MMLLDLTDLPAGKLAQYRATDGEHVNGLRYYHASGGGQTDIEIAPECSLINCAPWNHLTYGAMRHCWDHSKDVALSKMTRIPALIVACRSRCERMAIRARQYAQDGDERRALAKSLVLAKGGNQADLLTDRGRRCGDTMRSCISRMRADLAALPGKQDIDAIRGLEGIIARTYFTAWQMLTGLDGWYRTPRYWGDGLNILLDCCYARLCHSVTLALMAIDADLAVSILHAEGDGRPSLALDLMEPLRPLIADRLVLTLWRRQPVGWWKREGSEGEYVLTSAGRAGLRAAWSSWFYGSEVREGKIVLIHHLVEQWRRWLMCPDQGYVWPRYGD